MSVRTNHSGFSVVELLIVVVVLGLVGFVGLTIYNRQQDSTAPTNATASAADSTASVEAAPEINSTSDLDKSAAILDQTDTSSTSDSSELDTQLAAF